MTYLNNCLRPYITNWIWMKVTIMFYTWVRRHYNCLHKPTVY